MDNWEGERGDPEFWELKLVCMAEGLSEPNHPAGGGADELLPCVIYTILKANVPQMHSNLQYPCEKK